MQFIFQFYLKNIEEAKCMLLKDFLLDSFQTSQHFSQNNLVQTSLFLKKLINKAFNAIFFQPEDLVLKKRKLLLDKNYEGFLLHKMF